MLKRVFGWFDSPRPAPVQAELTPLLLPFDTALDSELIEQGQQLLDEAVAGGSDPAVLACMRSRLAAESGDFALALRQARVAVQLRPHDLRAMHALSVALSFGPRVPTALEEQLGLLARAPRDLPLLHDAALGARRQARYALASELVGRALRLSPEQSQLSSMFAASRFQQGHYDAEAWLHFVQQVGVNPWLGAAHGPEQAWREDIGAAGLRLWHSGGAGDFFQFCRFIPWLRQRRPRARIELAVPETLRGIAREIPAVDALVTPGTPLAPGQVHTSLLALPCILGAHEPGRFWNGPYIDAGNQPAAPPAAARIGIVWRSGWAPTRSAIVGIGQRLRNVPLLALLQALPAQAEIVCLQQGEEAQADIAALPAALRERMTQVACPTFSDTVRAIRAVDLVVSVDTSVAHLAGAMGHPLMVLGDYDVYWAWRAVDGVPPWYPQARVLVQQVADDWSGPLMALRALLAGNAG